jgi:hypothetical protein
MKKILSALIKLAVETRCIASLLVAAIAFSGCGKDDDNPGETPVTPPVLSVAPESIPATAAASSYPIAVTSNAAWTATIDAAATWCTLANASATGNGTVTVNVAENPTVEQRAATVTVASGTLTRAVAVNQAAFILPTPPNAASTQTWTFGSSTLTWSDAIRISDCNKPDFTESYSDPQCRSYTEGANIWYYYNWPYVNQNASTLCPSPWRVPTSSDFSALVNSSVTSSTLISEWGYGGYANGSSVSEVSTYAYYWPSTQYSSTGAYSLRYYSSGLNVSNTSKFFGLQVRCVR